MLLYNRRIFIIFFFLFFWYFNSYGSNRSLNNSIFIKLENKTDTIKLYQKDNISYIDLSVISKIFSWDIYYLYDREKIILKTSFNDNIILTINNPYIVINGKIFKLSSNILRDKKTLRVLIPYKSFFSILQNFYKGVLVVDSAYSNITLIKRQNYISQYKVLKKKNGYIIELYLPKRTIFDYNYFNNFLNINFFYLKISDSLKNKLKREKIIKEIKVYNFDNSSQISLKFSKKLVEKPKVFYKKDPERIIISLKTDFIKKQVKVKATQKKKESKKQILKKEKKKISKKEKKIPLYKKKQKKSKKFIVVIDAGHGGKDPGAIGYNGTFEKDITLSIAKYLYNYLKKEKNIEAVLTRNTDIFLKLKERADIANNLGADLFVSIHCNSVGTRKKKRIFKTKGFEVYFLSEAKTTEARATALLENQVIKYEDDKDYYDNLDFILTDVIQTEFLQESKDLAVYVAESMKKYTPIKPFKTGVNQAGFYVLKWAFMPSILVETGFISNPEEEKKLNNPEIQKRIAKAIYKGILEYMKKQKR